VELLDRTITLPSKTTIVRVYYLYDFHIGAFGFDDNLLRRHINRILREEFSYAIIGGDTAEYIGKRDPRYNPRGVHPMFHDALKKNNLVGAQVAHVKKRLRPLANQNRILGFLEGNHEQKMALHTDYNPVEEICTDLELPYGGGNCVQALRMKRKVSEGTRLCLTNAIHGKRGGATTAGKVTACERQAVRVRGCNIYMRGHGHVKFQLPGERVGAKMIGSKLKEYKEPESKGSSGSYARPLMPGGSSYAEDGEYPPTDLGCLFAEITPFAADAHDGMKMLVELRDLVM
jgi:hypothetical protein